jgi:hypothetical protein
VVAALQRQAPITPHPTLHPGNRAALGAAFFRDPAGNGIGLQFEVTE